MAHPTVPVSVGAWSADIDVELSEVVLALWRAGIETVSACQDEGESLLAFADQAPWFAAQSRAYAGRAYVDFSDLDAVARFLDAVANAGPRDELYQRMSSPATPHAWEVRVTFYDALTTQDSVDWTNPSTFAAGVVRVRFPRSDIAEIAERLAQRTD